MVVNTVSDYGMDIFKGRIFFLGAGFSANANIPLTDKLLPAALQLFEKESPGIYERIGNYADNIDIDIRAAPNAEDFAKFCTYLDFVELREYAGGERWSEKGCRERLALKYFLSKVIAHATPEISNIPSSYANFASDITANDIIVTLNWDVLLETTLEFLGKAYSYTGEWGKIHILKLHGSINWIEGAPHKFMPDRPDFGYLPLGIQEGLSETEIYSSRNLMSKQSWAASKCLLDEIKPMIVLPGYGKAVDARLLSHFWYRPEFLNMRQGGVSIIGLSVSHDDYIVQSLFHYLFRAIFSDGTPITVLNPDNRAEKVFNDLAGNAQQIRFIQRPFSDQTVDAALLKF